MKGWIKVLWSTETSQLRIATSLTVISIGSPIKRQRCVKGGLQVKMERYGAAMSYPNKLYDFVRLLHEGTQKDSHWDAWKIGQAGIAAVEDSEITNDYMRSALADVDPSEFILNLKYIENYIDWSKTWASKRKAIVNVTRLKRHSINSADDKKDVINAVIRNGIEAAKREVIMYQVDERATLRVERVIFWVRLKPGTWGPPQSWSLRDYEAMSTETFIPPLRIIEVAND